MVGAGNLIRLLFGLQYEFAVMIVGVVMLAYVLFGGMMATTWVQIVKAVLLLGGATLLAILVLARFGMNPLALFAEAQAQYGDTGIEPGAPGHGSARRHVARPCADARNCGAAAHSDALLHRCATRAPRARRSAMPPAFIGFFYLLTFILGFGAMVIVGRKVIMAVDAGGNMAAPLLAEVVGGTPFLGFIAAVAFATILAVVAGLTLSGAATLSHDLWVNVVRGAHVEEREQLVVARVATVVLAALSIILGITFKGQNVAYMVGLAFAIAASANFPALVLSIFWSRLTTAGAQASMLIGTVSTLALIYLSPTIQIDVLKHADAWFPLRNPGIITIPLSFVTAILVSLLRPVPADARRFVELERQLHLGVE
jgi:cation/acetate symporter